MNNKIVVLLRHGESVWNEENRFTGWTDVNLSKKGMQESQEAGKILKELGYQFDIVFTSVLKRAVQTFNLVCENLDSYHVQVVKDWRLNERHYGALQGLNKQQTAQKHGEQQVKIWRRSYDIPPPPLDLIDERNPSREEKYKNIQKNSIPLTESLKDCVERVLPLWKSQISEQILSGKNVLIVAHGNSIRSIVKYLDKISDQDIAELNIPTAIPLVYEFDKMLQPIKHYYLGDQKALQEKIQSVANQAKAKL